MGPILRFAPSPNGHLHLGHAFSALFTERAAAAIHGGFLLRIEDIDPERSKPEFEAGIIEDLAWLGVRWEPGILRQSTRLQAYASATDQLKERGLLYPCFCSRREIRERAAAFDPDGAPIYSGHCRDLSPADVRHRLFRGERPQWRLNMRRAAREAGTLFIEEAMASDVDAIWSKAVRRVADPAAWGDVVIVRKETATSYHLSVVVDDAAQGITHVTRGMDLFAATSLHVLLQRLLGLPQPAYCHHRLLVGEDGLKLSKSKNSESLKSMRERGRTPEEIRRQLDFI